MTEFLSRARRRPWAALALAAVLAACRGGADAPEVSAPAFLDPPAGEGSTEPYLSPGVDAVHLSWTERSGDGHALKVASLGPEGWGDAHTVTAGAPLFVNWADFPSVVEDRRGRLWVHWLERLEGGEGLAYQVRLASSEDGGRSWSEPWTPHEDGTATEHGFVSLFPHGTGVGLTWLDGRQYAPAPDGTPPTREMTVRFRAVGEDGGPGPEILVDARACDCCQTDVALAREGPVLVYRDRTGDEIRDIHLSRWAAGGWEAGAPVHADGWRIEGCPVNGPAVDARGDTVVVAWFTAAGGAPRVQVGFSGDGGRTFGAPLGVDGGDPAGRVDVRLLDGGDAAVTWFERAGGEAAELRLARVGEGKGVAAAVVVSRSSSSRSSGFPRLVLPPWDRGTALVAWTDVTDPERPRVRVASVEVPR